MNKRQVGETVLSGRIAEVRHSAASSNPFSPPDAMSSSASSTPIRLCLLTLYIERPAGPCYKSNSTLRPVFPVTST